MHLLHDLLHQFPLSCGGRWIILARALLLGGPLAHSSQYSSRPRSPNTPSCLASLVDPHPPPGLDQRGLDCRVRVLQPEPERRVPMRGRPPPTEQYRDLVPSCPIRLRLLLHELVHPFAQHAYRRASTAPKLQRPQVALLGGNGERHVDRFVRWNHLPATAARHHLNLASLGYRITPFCTEFTYCVHSFTGRLLGPLG